MGTIAYTLGHELTHFIKKWSPEKFKVFGDFLVEQYGKHGISTQEMLEAQMSKLNTTDEAIALENSGDIGVYYAKKEATDLIGAGVRFPVQLQERIASNSIIRSFDTKVNRKIADITQSQQFKRWFGDWQNHPESASKGHAEGGVSWSVIST